MQPRRLEEEFFQDIRYGVRMLLQSKDAWAYQRLVESWDQPRLDPRLHPLILAIY